MFKVCVKSGTNGYSDYGGIDLEIATIDSDNIPQAGEILKFGDKDNRKAVRYLVREVERSYVFATEKYPAGEYIYVYVINA